MVDLEVMRLRRLRNTALRVRAGARALQTRVDGKVDILDRGGCAAWRVARLANGRLRCHPYARFQRDASTVAILCNSVSAAMSAIGVNTRECALAQFEMQLRGLIRDLDDARVLTRVAELSEPLGRVQLELRQIYATILRETGHAADLRIQALPPVSATAGATWPYLAF